ncbi:hypothetical protein EOL70_16935 [Leucothrix sargassi]|nr:hypothetical protein EOL70_16935 [Leucothrix sargassi]
MNKVLKKQSSRKMDSSSLNILYVGSLGGTTQHRADALRRLGHNVTHVSPYTDLPKYWAIWLHKFGGWGIDWLVCKSLKKQLQNNKFDLIHVDNGDVIGPLSIKYLKTLAPKITNYNADNPFHFPSIEGFRWRLYRQAARHYDLVAAIRRVDLEKQMRTLGINNPLLVWQCADEVIHQPCSLEESELTTWETDIIFAGAWMPGRGEFLVELVRSGFNIKIYGNRWERSNFYKELEPAIQFKFLDKEEYSRAISAAKIAIVLLNGKNFDLHTKRSVEIPSIGTAMCAPRTIYHEELYSDQEVMLFDDVSECVEKCKYLIENPTVRENMVKKAKERTYKNRTYNEYLFQDIFNNLR